jgi:hypothetical protein
MAGALPRSPGRRCLPPDQKAGHGLRAAVRIEQNLMCPGFPGAGLLDCGSGYRFGAVGEESGKVGAEAARLLAQRGEPVRVLVRDPEKLLAQPSARQVSHVRGPCGARPAAR